MSHPKPPTATPLRHRLNRARLRLLPLLFFVFVCSASYYLWQFQNTAVVEVGLVEVVSHVVVSPAAGKIAHWSTPDGKPLPVNSVIDKNETIAVLDDAPLRATLDDLSQQSKRLREFVAIRWPSIDITNAPPLSEAIALIKNHSSSVDRKIYSLSQQLAFRSVDLELSMLKKSAVTSSDMQQLQQLQTRRATLAAQLTPWQPFGSGNANALTSDLSGVDEQEFENADRLAFMKLRETCQSIDEQLAAARQTGDLLNIVSPFRGQVDRASVGPHENVTAGTPIITITQMRGKFVIAYARENRGQLATPGSPVVIGLRGQNNPTADSFVDSVGATFVSIPPRQRLNSNIEEWGRVIRIPVPDDFFLVPGSLVDVTFFPSREGPASQNLTAKNKPALSPH